MGVEHGDRDVPVVVIGRLAWYQQVAPLFLPYHTIVTYLMPSEPIDRARVVTAGWSPAVILVVEGSGRHHDEVRTIVETFRSFVQTTSDRERTLVIIVVGASVAPMGRYFYVVPTPEAIGTVLPTLVVERVVTPRQPKTKALVVGCAKGGVGKTLVTLTYAQAFARLGAATLVIEADIANPSIGAGLRLDGDSQVVHPYLALIKANSDSAHRPLYGLEKCQIEVFQGSPWAFSVLLSSTKSFLPLQGNKVNDLAPQLFDELVQTSATLSSPTTQRSFDAMIIDTSPDIYPRPYLLQVLQRGGYAIIPLPPGRLERESTDTLYTIFDLVTQRLPADLAADYWRRIMIQPIAGEHGSLVSIELVLRSSFLDRWRERGVTVLEPLPRDPALVSSSLEDQTVVPLLKKGEHRAFGVIAYRNAETIARLMGITVQAYRPNRWQVMKTAIARLIGREPLRAASTLPSIDRGIQPS